MLTAFYRREPFQFCVKKRKEEKKEKKKVVQKCLNHDSIVQQ